MAEVAGRVYVLVDEHCTRVKVGWTGGDPEKRRRAIETASGLRLHLVTHYAGTRCDEAEAHRVLAAWHILGEWFHWSSEVLAYLFKDHEVYPIVD